MSRHRFALTLFLVCYCRFAIAWPDAGGKVNQGTPKPVCTHGGLLNGVFLHGGPNPRNDTIFTQVAGMHACIDKCCKLDKCDLAMMIGDVCHAVKCPDEDSCQITHSKGGGQSVKAQISFITKAHHRVACYLCQKATSSGQGEELKDKDKESQRTKVSTTLPKFPLTQVKTDNENFPQQMRSSDNSSGKFLTKYTTFISESGSAQSEDDAESESNSGTESIDIDDDSGLKSDSSGDDDDDSGSSDDATITSKPDSSQTESAILPKPSSGRSAIPKPRASIQIGDSSTLLQTDLSDAHGENYFAMSTKQDNKNHNSIYNGDNDFDDDDGGESGSGLRTNLSLKDVSGDDTLKSPGSGEGKLEKSKVNIDFAKTDSISMKERKFRMKAEKPLLKPIKTAIPSNIYSPTAKTFQIRQKDAKQSLSDLPSKNDKDARHKNRNKMKNRQAQKDIKKQSVTQDSTLATIRSVKMNSKINNNAVRKNDAGAKDFNSIARQNIIEKPLTNLQKESTRKKKTITKLQYQLSNLLAKNSEHITSSNYNAPKMSGLPKAKPVKKQKMFDKILRVQRERENERYYKQATSEKRKGHPLYELLQPQQSTKCKRGATIRGATLKGGVLAGDFQTVGIVNNQQQCVKSCCGNRRCDVALMLGKECFNVRCYSENLCGLAPATALFADVTPVITYVRGHISKRSTDYDFEDDAEDQEQIIEKVVPKGRRRTDTEIAQFGMMAAKGFEMGQKASNDNKSHTCRQIRCLKGNYYSLSVKEHLTYDDGTYVITVIVIVSTNERENGYAEVLKITKFLYGVRKNWANSELWSVDVLMVDLYPKVLTQTLLDEPGATSPRMSRLMAWNDKVNSKCFPLVAFRLALKNRSQALDCFSKSLDYSFVCVWTKPTRSSKFY
eukprot:gene17840-19621_t